MDASLKIKSLFISSSWYFRIAAMVATVIAAEEPRPIFLLFIFVELLSVVMCIGFSSFKYSLHVFSDATMNLVADFDWSKFISCFSMLNSGIVSRSLSDSSMVHSDLLLTAATMQECPSSTDHSPEIIIFPGAEHFIILEKVLFCCFCRFSWFGCYCVYYSIYLFYFF